MKDLEFFELPLGSIKLEKLDVWNRRHIRAVKGLRDLKARTMCYDLKGLICDKKRNVDRNGNSYLVKDIEKDNYIGYMYISNRHPGNVRVLSYIINKKMRNSGYGTIMLSSVSDFLFEYGLANEIELYIKRYNDISRNLALKCGFTSSGYGSNISIEKYSKKNR